MCVKGTSQSSESKGVVHGPCFCTSAELRYQDSQTLPPPHRPLAMSGGTRSLLRVVLLSGSISPIFHTPSGCISVVGEVVLFLSSTQAYKYVGGAQKHFRVSGRMLCGGQCDKFTQGTDSVGTKMLSPSMASLLEGYLPLGLSQLSQSKTSQNKASF